MLIDFGADINSIYRLPGNVVQTPLDCALSKGHRSTAKFLQLHGGLPANKLRLSGRNPNALNDQELVKPLTFSGDKSQYAAYMENELPKKSRSVWLYVNQSDSDAGMCILPSFIYNLLSLNFSHLDKPVSLPTFSLKSIQLILLCLFWAVVAMGLCVGGKLCSHV